MKKRIPLFAACLVLLSAGCQNTVNTVENMEKQSVRHEVSDRRISTDPFLKNRLRITSVSTATTPDGIMTVQIACKNMRVGVASQVWSWMTGENPYPIQYKFDWFDKNGMKFDTVLSTWQETTIIPGETAYLQGVAPHASCRDFKLSLKEAENRN